MSRPTVRLQARVEIGPNRLDSSWQVFDVSPNTFEDQGVFDDELIDIEEILDELEKGPDGELDRNDSGGPLFMQVRCELEDMLAHVNDQGTLPKRRQFTFALPGENENLDVNIIPSNSLEHCE